MDEELLQELFSGIGPVRVKRMFGGQGIYAEERIVAVVVSGELYLKTDALTAAEFEAAGCRQWLYQRAGRAPTRTSYYAPPEAVFEDPEVMLHWAGKALEAARRYGQQPKPKRKRPSRP